MTAITAIIYLVLGAIFVIIPQLILAVVFQFCEMLLSAMAIITPEVVWGALGGLSATSANYSISNMLIDLATLLGAILMLLSLFNTLTAPVLNKNAVHSPFNIALRGVVGIVFARVLAINFAKGIWSLFGEIQIMFLNEAGSLMRITNLDFKGIASAFSNLSQIDGLSDVFAAMGDFLGSWAGNIIAFILANLMAVLVLWNFLKLILELAQRTAITIFYVLLSPLATVTIASPSTSGIASKWLQGLFSQCILMVLNGWCVAIGVSAVNLMYSGPSGLAAIVSIVATYDAGLVFLGASLIAYGILKALQQLDDLFNNIGASVVRQHSDILGDMLGMRATVAALSNIPKSYINNNKKIAGASSKMQAEENLRNRNPDGPKLDKSQMTAADRRKIGWQEFKTATNPLTALSVGHTQNKAAKLQRNDQAAAATARKNTLESAKKSTNDALNAHNNAAKMSNVADNILGEGKNNIVTAQALGGKENIDKARDSILDTQGQDGFFNAHKNTFEDNFKDDVAGTFANAKAGVDGIASKQSDNQRRVSQLTQAMEANGVSASDARDKVQALDSASGNLASAIQNEKAASALSNVLKDEAVAADIKNTGEISSDTMSKFKAATESAGENYNQALQELNTIKNAPNATPEEISAAQTRLSEANAHLNDAVRAESAVAEIATQAENLKASNVPSENAYAQITGNVNSRMKAAEAEVTTAESARNAAISDIQTSMSGSASEQQAVEAARAYSNDATYVATTSADNKMSEKQFAAMQSQYVSDAQNEMSTSWGNVQGAVNDLKTATDDQARENAFNNYSQSVADFEGVANKYSDSVGYDYNERLYDAVEDTAEAHRESAKAKMDEVKASGAIHDPGYSEYAKTVLGHPNATSATLEWDDSIGAIRGVVHEQEDIKDKYGNVTGSVSRDTVYNDVRGTVDSEGIKSTQYVSSTVFETTASRDENGNVNRATVNIFDGNSDYIPVSGKAVLRSESATDDKGSSSASYVRSEEYRNAPITIHDNAHGIAVQAQLDIRDTGHKNADGENIMQVQVLGTEHSPQESSFIAMSGKKLDPVRAAESFRTGNFDNITVDKHEVAPNSIIGQIHETTKTRRAKRPMFMIGGKQNRQRKKTHGSRRVPPKT